MDWKDWNTVVGAIVVPLVALVLTAVAQFISDRVRRGQRGEIAELDEALKKTTEDYLDKFEITFTDADSPVARYWMPQWTPIRDQSARDEAALRENAELVERLQNRLDAIEERLPEASTIDKITSVNDAIMATKIEALEKEISRLEASRLSRWDVVVVVFAILTAVGGIVAIIVPIIQSHMSK